MAQRSNLGISRAGIGLASTRPNRAALPRLPLSEGAVAGVRGFVLRALAAERRHPATSPLLVTLLIGVCAGALALLGQPLTCPCGHVALWAGDIATNQNSQQIADIYSIEHAASGLLLLVALRPLPAHIAHSTRLIGVAIGAVAWEFLENSAWMIQRYREATISAHYAGDSVLNSSTDVLFCCLAFTLAARLPWRASLTVVVLSEVLVTLLIRDSILLSLVALVTGSDALREWQIAR